MVPRAHGTSTMKGMEADDLLCSRNARPQKALVGRAQWKINQPPSLKRERASLDGSSWITRCGLACGKARLGAPGWAGEKAAFLRSLPQNNRARQAGCARRGRVRDPKFEVFGTSNPELRTLDRPAVLAIKHMVGRSGYMSVWNPRQGRSTAAKPQPVDYPLPEEQRLGHIERPIQSTRSSPTSRSIAILSASRAITVPARKT